VSPTLPALLLGVLLASQQAQPSPPPPTRGTATLRGQITDADTGVPIPRAVITARLFTRDSTQIVIQNVADIEGRFELLNLAAGGYQVSATAGEHRASHVREPFPAAHSSGALDGVVTGDETGESELAVRRIRCPARTAAALESMKCYRRRLSHRAGRIDRDPGDRQQPPPPHADFDAVNVAAADGDGLSL
jgi:hypothetical protein